MQSFLVSYILITLAEMGDKTQLLAMAFSTRYSPSKVLAGVLIATLLNHAAAVAAGRFISSFIPMEIVYLLASLSFIVFGLWTIKGDPLNGETAGRPRYGRVITVAAAFFLAEMGDKTQLATVSLAARYPGALAVLCGTTLGMITADAAGIGIGVVMRRRLPQEAVKWISAAVFVIFGLAGVFRTSMPRLGPVLSAAVTSAVAAASVFSASRLYHRRHKKFDKTTG
ncbi:MAG: TMEM165/GDT1 family protein [Candidatus Omnitrophica bacterium]|nr:TMEM165/GDT1 family protein [Candidatus Omnitrophota bacterium]